MSGTPPSPKHSAQDKGNTGWNPRHLLSIFKWGILIMSNRNRRITSQEEFPARKRIAMVGTLAERNIDASQAGS